MNSVYCSKCVCTWMGQIQRTHFTTSYTLYNCVTNTIYLFFLPIMVKCLNIGKNIGQPIYQSISSLICSPCAFEQSLYRVLIREIERDCTALAVMHRWTFCENVDSAKIKVTFYKYRYFTRGIDASYRHTLYRYIDPY